MVEGLEEPLLREITAVDEASELSKDVKVGVAS